MKGWVNGCTNAHWAWLYKRKSAAMVVCLPALSLCLCRCDTKNAGCILCASCCGRFCCIELLKWCDGNRKLQLEYLVTTTAETQTRAKLTCRGWTTKHCEKAMCKHTTADWLSRQSRPPVMPLSSSVLELHYISANIFFFSRQFLFAASFPPH